MLTNPANVAKELRKTALFTGLPEKRIAANISTAHYRQFQAGETIVAEGRQGIGFYLIVEGAAIVLKDDTPVAQLNRGSYFGETALLVDDGTRTATVVATQDTNCLVMSRWDLRGMIAGLPELGARIAHGLAQHAQSATRTASTGNPPGSSTRETPSPPA